VYHVGDSLDPSMWVAGEPCLVVIGVIGVEIVEEQKRIEQRGLVVSESTLQMYPCTFNCGFSAVFSQIA
jgi:hypothetical protein